MGGVFGSVFGGGGAGAPSPDSDSVTSITVSGLGRLDPVEARISMPSTLDLFIYYRSGVNYRLEIYDPVNGFAGAFTDQSTIEVDGTDVILSILPNGGWWTGDFKLVFVSGRELEL